MQDEAIILGFGTVRFKLDHITRENTQIWEMTDKDGSALKIVRPDKKWPMLVFRNKTKKTTRYGCDCTRCESCCHCD